MSAKPTKRARPAPAATTEPAIVVETKRAANTAKMRQNSTPDADEPVRLTTTYKPSPQPPQPTNNNIKQQQTDHINSLKKKAIADAALFPIHAQALSKFLTLDNSIASPHEFATAFSALTAVYVHHIEKGSLYHSTTAIPSDLAKKVQDIETKKTLQFHSFLSTFALCLRQNPSQNTSLHKTCWKLGFQLISTLGIKDTKTLGTDRVSNPLWTFLYSWLGANIIQPIIMEDFYHMQLAPYDDIRFFTYQFINTILPIISDPATAPSHWTTAIPDCHAPIFRSNVLQLMSMARFSLVTGKRMVKSAHISNSMSEFSNKQRSLLSNNWFVFLKAIKIGDITKTLGYIPPPGTRKENEQATFVPIYDDVSIYTRIFAVMDSLILPNITQPLLLADFLSASFNIGGLIAVQALKGLFTLMQKHKLEYPHFFNQLYHICTLDILYSPYSVTFFTLLNLVLNGNYIPFYLVIGFMKKLVRLALFGPTTATIYITALVFNIYRKHPMTAYLINRKATIVQGVAKNAQMSQDLSQFTSPTTPTTTITSTLPDHSPITMPQSRTNPTTTMQDDDGSDPTATEPQVNLFALLKASKTAPKVKKADRFLNTLSLTTTPAPHNSTTTTSVEKKQAAKSHLIQQPDVTAQEIQAKWVNGQDPFVVDIFGIKNINPENSNGRTSSLIELKDLVNHFLQQVRVSAKLSFDDNAPKHPQEISNLLLLLTFHTIIQQSLTYRSKNLIPTAFQKPLSLLGKSERIAIADERYDDEARMRGEALDNERNTIESIFMW